MSKPKCTDCKHYFITYDPKIPNGCRQYGIKCKAMPTEIVASAGQGDCRGFEPKRKPETKKPGLDLNRNDLW
jgi:hypothetical protein